MNNDLKWKECWKWTKSQVEVLSLELTGIQVRKCNCFLPHITIIKSGVNILYEAYEMTQLIINVYCLRCEA